MTGLEQSVIEAVNHTGIPYEVVEIDPEFSDTVALCERYGIPPGQTCNMIIVTSKKGEKKHIACVIQANTRLDVNKRVRHLLGVSKASFATPEEMMKLTGMQVGGVTPFSLPTSIPIYVDDRVLKSGWVILGGGSRRLKIKVSPDIFAKLGAEVVSGLALE